MTWQPGMPVITPSDQTAWQAWRTARKLEQQRARRQRNPRIDYYPSKEAMTIIDAHIGNIADGNYSSVIDALVLAGAKKRHV